MDQRRAPVLEALADYQRQDRYGFSPPGHRRGRGADASVLAAVIDYLRSGLAAGMVLPDATDSTLEHIRVVA